MDFIQIYQQEKGAKSQVLRMKKAKDAIIFLKNFESNYHLVEIIFSCNYSLHTD